MVLVGALASPEISIAEPAAPEAEVREVVERWFRADALGSAEELKSILGAATSIVEKRGSKWVPVTAETLASRASGVAPDEFRRVRRVESLRVSHSEASVVLSVESPRDKRRDRLTLKPETGGWRIVADRRETTPKPSPAEDVRTLLAEWTKPVQPFHILGNVHYVGANGVSAFLLTTPSGHVLLDSGPVEMLPRLERNIEALGFHLADVKLLLNSHAHYDHCGAFAEIKRRTGASLIASEADGTEMEHGGLGDFAYGDDYRYEPVTPDRHVGDGERVELGGLSLTAILTPGHTRGCTTWSTRVEEGGRTYDVVFVCGLTVAPFKLTNNPVYPAVAADTRRSIARLRAQHADVMLAAHGFWFDLTGKASRLAQARRTGATNPFVDPGQLGRHLDEVERDLAESLAAQEHERAP